MHVENGIGVGEAVLERDPAFSLKADCGGKTRKVLNFTISNNEQSLLKLHQALIRFKVMKKTTQSITINPKEVNLYSEALQVVRANSAICRIAE